MRMRPGKPLAPPSAVTPNTPGKKDGKRRRKREKLKLVRARRRTIDPTKWDSQHLKGAFLDSIVVTDDGGNLPAATPSGPDTTDDQEETDPSGEEEEEEEGDESDSSEPESVVEGAPKATDIAQTKCNMVDTDHDFNQEKLRALSLLDSMFGGLARDQEWGGEEALDSDDNMQELPPVEASPPPKSFGSSSERAFENPALEPAIEEVQEDSESEDSSAAASTPVPERAPISVAIQNANTTKAKLKDLFAPQEEKGAPHSTNCLSRT